MASLSSLDQVKREISQPNEVLSENEVFIK